jgi:hypothetical protein
MEHENKYNSCTRIPISDNQDIDDIPFDITKDTYSLIDQNSKLDLNVNIVEPEPDQLNSNYLTNDQQKVFDSISNIVKNKKNSIITLSSQAGCGKTFVLNHLIDFGGLQDAKTTAPTNKAVTLLDGNNASTIHSHLKLKLQPNFRDGGYELVKTKGNTKWHNVLIVDESSMISSELHDYILASDSFNHLIYVGDHNQLLPVDDSNADFTIFNLSNIYKFKLTKNMRTDNKNLHKLFNDVLLCDSWANIVDVLEAADVVDVVYDKKEFVEDFLKVNRKSNESGIIGAFTNKKVDLYNEVCRMMTLKGIEDPIHPDDILVMQEGNGEDIKNAEHLRVKNWYKDIDNNAYVINTICMKQFMTPMNWGIYYNKLKKLKNLGIKKKEWRNYYKFKEMYLDYRYHYASTLHKLQGSTYRDVHLDLQGLGMVDFDTVKRLVYVGLTRTSGDKVTVLL